jgi:predicted dehydrogenase
MERLNELEVYFDDDENDVQGFRTILVTQPEHEYMKFYWPPGHILGWDRSFCHQYYEFFKAISNDYKPSPGFYDGLKSQEVIEASQISALERRWVKI